MIHRHVLRIRGFFLALAALTMLTTGPLLDSSRAMTQDSQQFRGEQRSAPPPKRSEEPSSVFWRSFLWESIPSEWLTNTARQPITQAYEARGWKPLFITAFFEINRGARDLMAALGQLDSHAIDPTPFRLDRLEAQFARLESSRVALASVDNNYHDSVAALGERPSFEATQIHEQEPTLQRYASNSPEVMLPDPSLKKEKEALYQEAFKAATAVDLALVETLIRFAREMDSRSDEAISEALQGSLTISDFIQRVIPNSPQYRALRSAYARYRALTDQHVRQPIITGDGSSGGSTRDLQSRLQQEGFYEGKITGHFDASTQQALRSFQQAHQINPDGRIGKQTKDWLNTSYARKAQMLAASLKAARQSDTRRLETFLRINIPQFTLEYVRNGQVQRTHRVIVGKAGGRKVKQSGRLVGENHTPTLSSTVQHIVINPRWYINDRIWREIAGGLADDPTLYERRGYGIARGYYAGGAPRVYQEPGPSNPLGQVKFEFPNDHAVYVHDTPKKHLFSNARRDFSHGCVRLEHARALAEAIVNDDQNAIAPKFKNLFDTRRTTYIKLNDPIPIMIEYMPVVAGEGDSVVFIGDPYGSVEQPPSKRS